MASGSAIAFFQSQNLAEGGYLPTQDVRISPDDRGFMFADGVYEVIRSYGGRLFCVNEHLARLERSLAELRIALGRPERLRGIARAVLDRNGLAEADATVYIQVTRGASPRQHVFPSGQVVPTLYVEANRLAGRPETAAGVACVTFPDIRWGRCDIKSIALLPNVLAGQYAAEHDCYEAFFARDGQLTEGSHSTIFGVRDSTVITHQLDNSVLPGVTRGVILALCRQLGIAVEERPVRVDELGRLDELFLSCTTAEVLPVLAVDSRPIGAGRPGPVTARLGGSFRDHVERWTCAERQQPEAV